MNAQFPNTNSVKRAEVHKPNTRSFAPFLSISDRDDRERPSLRAVDHVARGSIPPSAPRVYFNESRGGVEGHARTVSPSVGHAVGAGPKWTNAPASRFRVLPARLSYDASLRRNLVSANADHLLFKRATPLRSNLDENIQRSFAKALGGISGGLHFDQRPHVGKHDRGRFTSGQNLFAKGASNV